MLPGKVIPWEVGPREGGQVWAWAGRLAGKRWASKRAGRPWWPHADSLGLTHFPPLHLLLLL